MPVNIKIIFSALCLLLLIKKSAETCEVTTPDFINDVLKYGYRGMRYFSQRLREESHKLPANSCNVIIFCFADTIKLPKNLAPTCEELNLSLTYYGSQYYSDNDHFDCDQRIKSLNVSDNTWGPTRNTQKIIISCPQVTTIYLKNSGLGNIYDEYFVSITNLQVLHLENNEIGKIAEDAFPSTLEELHLQHNRLDSDQLGFLNVTSNLTILNLANNKITDIQEDLFSGLSRLKELYLNNNLIETFEHNELDNLEVFDISNNLLSTISVNLPKCKHLGAPQVGFQTITLDSNTIKLLGPGEGNITLDAPHLEYLDLSYNNLTTIDVAIFEKSTELNHLNLSFNLIEKIDEKSEITLNKLTRLDLQGNKILHLKTSLISNSENLQVLNLRSNNLKHINLDAFKNFSNLEYLFLDKNNFDTIDVNLFVNAINLKELNLSHNAINSLGAVLKNPLNLEKLEILDLNNNQLSESALDLFFENAENLKYFDISHNNLKVIKKNVFKFCNNITKLPLNNNNIKDIDADGFFGLENLRDLQLQHNHLTALSAPIFQNNLQLYRLDLSYNLITEINDEVFKSLHELYQINLQNNKLTKIRVSTFIDCQLLFELNLANNLIKQIEPNTFTGPSIYKLDLHNNQLDSIAGAFHGANHIARLDLSQNSLDALHYGSFDDLTELSSLNLSYNQISEIPDSIFRNHRYLIELYLDNNRLSKLKLESSQVGRRLKVISLHNNKWSCKDLSELVKHLEDTRVEIVNSDPVVHTHNINQIQCDNAKFVTLNESSDDYFKGYLSNLKKHTQNINISLLLNEELEKSDLFKYFKNFNKTDFFKYFESLNNNEDFHNMSSFNPNENNNDELEQFLIKFNKTNYDYFNRLRLTQNLIIQNKLQHGDQSLGVFLFFNIIVLLAIILALIVSIYFIIFKKKVYFNVARNRLEPHE